MSTLAPKKWIKIGDPAGVLRCQKVEQSLVSMGHHPSQAPPLLHWLPVWYYPVRATGISIWTGPPGSLLEYMAIRKAVIKQDGLHPKGHHQWFCSLVLKMHNRSLSFVQRHLDFCRHWLRPDPKQSEKPSPQESWNRDWSGLQWATNYHNIELINTQGGLYCKLA